MTVRLLKPATMTTELWNRWHDLLHAHPSFASPYFHPDFARAVAMVREDVEIAVIEDAGDVIGFFPFQRRGSSSGKPLGGRLSDYQGVIGQPGHLPNGGELLNQCRLDSYDFDHWLGWQTEFAAGFMAYDQDCSIDLSAGWEAYRSELEQRESNLLYQTRRKQSSIERTHGPLRFEWNLPDRRLLETLIAWKSRQYRQTGVFDVFQVAWPVELLKRLLVFESGGRDGTTGLRGALAALYCGDEVIALHFGMHTERVLHAWFPAYDPHFAQFSPGTKLFLEITRAAAERGIQRIDFGRTAAWKERIVTRHASVAEGTLDLRPLRRNLRRGWRATKNWIKSTPLRWPAKLPGMAAYYWRERADFK